MRGIRSRFGAVFSVSATTRGPGPGEVDAVDYYFITPEQFQAMVDEGKFLEYAQVFGRDWYGTPDEPVERELSRGVMAILDIDVQGALQIREKRPDAFMVFILPPSEEELMRRLRDRGREDEAAIQRRFEAAKREISLARSTNAYDAFIVNDDLERAIQRTCDAIEVRRANPPASGGSRSEGGPESERRRSFGGS
jgi:guanylate kinase